MKKIINISLLIFLLFSFYLFYFAYQNFLGNKFFYVLFSIISYFSIFFSFRKNGFFLEKFLTIYLWLGFWLKFSLYQGFFMDNPPSHGFGNFDFSNESLNNLMLTSSLPYLSISVSSFFIAKMNFLTSPINSEFLSKFYQNYKSLILSLLIFFIVFVSLTNFKFGIYQKGLISQADLPFIISGFYKWYYLMGAGVILSILLNFELKNYNKISNKLYLVLIFESLISNFTLLSRAMIFNISSIFFGIYKSISSIHLNKKEYIKMILYYILTLIIFVLLVSSVNKVRDAFYFTEKKVKLENKEVLGKAETKSLVFNSTISEKSNISNKSIISNKNNILEKNHLLKNRAYKIIQLVYIRFVGIESLMAVSSYDELNFENFQEAFNEKIDYSNYNHYFLKYNLLQKNNSNKIFKEDQKDLKKSQYTIHVPGIVAFLYYSGSNIFLFFSLIILMSLFYSLERFVYYSSSGNLILTAFISHIICYRLIHFGYVPTQSYLFFGSLLFTIFIIFIIHKFLR